MIFMGNGEHSEDACNDRHLRLKELFSDLSGLQQAGGSFSQEEMDKEWGKYIVKAQRFLERLQKDLLDKSGSTKPNWNSKEVLAYSRRAFENLKDDLHPKPDDERWNSWDDMRHVVPEPPPKGRPYMDDD